MLIYIQQTPWSEVAKTWGPLGIGFVFAIVLTAALLRLGKHLLTTTIDDARKERDYMRQMRERELERFIESLKLRDELMKDGFDEVLREIRNHRDLRNNRK